MLQDIDPEGISLFPDTAHLLLLYQKIHSKLCIFLMGGQCQGHQTVPQFYPLHPHPKDLTLNIVPLQVCCQWVLNIPV